MPSVASSAITTIRNRIEAQGFCGLDDDTYRQMNLPLRLAPTVCLVWTAIGTARESSVTLWALVPFAMMGAISRGHPFDVIWNHGLRHVVGAPALPPYGTRRRFACALATLILIVAASSFATGLRVAGHVAGWSVVAAAFVNASAGFCIPSFLARVLFGRVICSAPPVSPGA